MGYILRQYNHIPGDGSADFYTDPDTQESLNCFLNPIPSEDLVVGCVQRVGGFKDPRVTYGSKNTPGFQAGAHYYFHGMLGNGNGYTYNVKLTMSDSVEPKEQFIKTIKTSSGTITDVEFIFTPVVDFYEITFELDTTKMTGSDQGPQNIALGVCEIDLIYNIMGTKLNMLQGKNLPPILKAGVQSRPGLLLCINGEDIRLPHNGIYEVKNGVILVEFFSVVTPFPLSTQARTWKESPSGFIAFPVLTNQRVTDGFTIDYLYYVNDLS